MSVGRGQFHTAQIGQGGHRKLMTPAAGNPDGIESLGEKMTKRQNTSYAVMAPRIEAQDSLDDFPTPPWATRALIEHVLGGKKRVKSQVCLEPACGFGEMATG